MPWVSSLEVFAFPAELFELFFCLFFRDPVLFLKLPDQSIVISADHVQLIVGQPAPLFLHLPFELLPISFDLVPIHFLISMIKKPGCLPLSECRRDSDTRVRLDRRWSKLKKRSST